MTPAIRLIQIALCILVTVSPAFSEEPAEVINGVRFARRSQEGDTTLTLRGVATLRYLKIIKAYAGGLYLPETVRSEDVLSDTPKQLVLEYFQPIDAEGFATATRSMVEENTEAATLARIAPELDRLCLAYLAVRPTDRYTLSYHPEKGLSLTLNSTLLGTFKGDDFSRAMFSIWIGEHPIDKTFRNRLLGR